MDLSDMYAISDLILQKLNSLQDEGVTGNIERNLLKPYVKQLSDLQNVNLIQSYANQVFGMILTTVVCKVMYEITLKEPDLNKLKTLLEPIDKFIRGTIGLTHEEIQYRIEADNSTIISDLDTLKNEMTDWITNMPQVAMASEVPEDIKKGLNELKEQFMKMKKENKKWNK